MLRPLLIHILLGVTTVCFAADPEPQFHVESRSFVGGFELLTVFGTAPDNSGDIPLLTLLRDTLGDADPDNDRLRNVWILTTASPSVLQRIAAAIPFFYFQPKLSARAGRTPGSVLDLADTRSPVWNALAQTLAQALAIDSNGALIRASTRRYRTNLADRRRVHLIEGLAVLSQLEGLPEVRTLLSQPDLLEIQARLTLASQTLGGLVNAEKLPEAYFNQRTRTRESRGHNWELLRQQAEANGLYFEPLGLGDSRTHALVYVAKEDVADRKKRRGLAKNQTAQKVPPSAVRLSATGNSSSERSSPGTSVALTPPDKSTIEFSSGFLNFANPYTDKHLSRWKGATVERFFDASNRPVANGTPGARRRELIPLGLYSLDYPKVPLLLIDFRDSTAPKRREIIRRGITDTLTGVLGISKWGNWPYMAGAWAFNFVISRHGSPTNREARLAAYSEVRRWLALDHSLDTDLRKDLQRRLEVLGINPLEENVFEETGIARQQYAALLKYAADPHGLEVRLGKDRDAELAGYRHGGGARFLMNTAHWASLGIYSHHETRFGPAKPSDNASLLAAMRPDLDSNRRTIRNVKFLEAVAKSGPRVEVVWNMGEIRKAVDSLAALGMPERSAQLIQQILAQTKDPETLALCERALASFHAATE